jgi:hypothetical protein
MNYWRSVQQHARTSCSTTRAVGRRLRMRKATSSLLSAGALIAALGGCSFSTTRYGWPGSYAPAGIPNAQDCVPIHWGQPTDFACPDGKVYTAQQLKSLREDKAKKTLASAGY